MGVVFRSTKALIVVGIFASLSFAPPILADGSIQFLDSFFKSHCTGIKNRLILMKNKDERANCQMIKNQLNEFNKKPAIAEIPCGANESIPEKKNSEVKLRDWMVDHGEFGNKYTRLSDYEQALQFALNLGSDLERAHKEKRVYGTLRPENVVLSLSPNPAENTATNRAKYQMSGFYTEKSCKEGMPNTLFGDAVDYRPASSVFLQVEQNCKKSVEIGMQGDVFAHALTVYALLYGAPKDWGKACLTKGKIPLALDTNCVDQFKADLSKSKEGVDRLIAKALDSDPKKRPSAGAFNRELKRLVSKYYAEKPVQRYSFNFDQPYQIRLKGKIFSEKCDRVFKTMKEFGVVCENGYGNEVTKKTIDLRDVKNIKALPTKRDRY